jgi:hypothetical protein
MSSFVSFVSFVLKLFVIYCVIERTASGFGRASALAMS